MIAIARPASPAVKRIDVPVYFAGTVTVLVPGDLAASDARLLANKVALARILATTDNPDAPEADACEDYADQCSANAQPTAEQDWDSCRVQGVGGT
jgi:hypothetical protein